MMMPANFSAVAENEMTYVVGGSLVDVLAPVMTAENWQNVSYNLIQIVGNTFLQKEVNAAFSTIFGGTYHVGDVAGKAWDKLSRVWMLNDNGSKTQPWAFGNALLNTGLLVGGVLASVYTLGSGKIGLKVEAYED